MGVFNVIETMFENTNNILQELGCIKRAMFTIPSVSKTTPEVFTNIRENEDKIVVSDGEEEDDEEEDDEDDDEDDEDEDEEGEDEDYDEEEDDDEEVLESKIKIVNIDVLDKIAVEDITDELADEEIEEDLEETVMEVNGTAIKVDKADESDVSETAPPTDDFANNQRDVYNKMSVQELKKLVITKGLCSDATRLKKPDLLKLLGEP